MRKRRPFFQDEDLETDPLSGMANLFDLAMVFAVALMVAVVTSLQISDLLTEDNATIVKNPGKENMEIIIKTENRIERYTLTEGTGEGRGRRVGIAYELEDGQFIYVPELDAAPSAVE